MKREPVAYIPDDLFEKGIGQVVVCRFKGDDRVEVGVFLTDVWCLGVKDGFFLKETVSELENRLLPRIYAEGGLEPRPGADGRKLIEGAVDYARKLGLAPCGDYKKAARVFGGIDPRNSEASFTYGKNGKPLYVAGPYDNADRMVRLLGRKLGADGFHFIMPAEPYPDE